MIKEIDFKRLKYIWFKCSYWKDNKYLMTMLEGWIELETKKINEIIKKVNDIDKRT